MNQAADETVELEQGPPEKSWRVSACFQGESNSRRLSYGCTITLGTSEDVDLRVDDRAVSALHCSLTAGDTGIEVRDLKSKNGIWVGPARVDSVRSFTEAFEFFMGRTLVSVVPLTKPLPAGDLGLVGQTESMAKVRELIRRFAPLGAPVLVLGESGTGKDVVARALHQYSARSGTYVATNVAAMTDTLLDAELFGHVRGAFTGALQARAGAFQVADRGTLFLDEIADLSAVGQAKLLRVVEDGRVRPVGSDKDVQVSTRLVLATCADVEARVEKGAFRHDLFHRIGVLRIKLPPLRHRLADVPLLVHAYLENKRVELGARYIPPATLEFLMAQRWPGNVRQLFSSIYAASATTSSQTLLPSHFQLPAAEYSQPQLAPEQALALLDSHGSMSAAARAARIPRTTFRALVARARSG